MLGLTDVEDFAALAVLDVKDGVVAHFSRRAETLVPGCDDASVFVHRNFKMRFDAVLRVDRARRVPDFPSVRTQFQSVDARPEQ